METTTNKKSFGKTYEDFIDRILEGLDASYETFVG